MVLEVEVEVEVEVELGFGLEVGLGVGVVIGRLFVVVVAVLQHKAEFGKRPNAMKGPPEIFWHLLQWQNVMWEGGEVDL